MHLFERTTMVNAANIFIKEDVLAGELKINQGPFSAAWKRADS